MDLRNMSADFRSLKTLLVALLMLMEMAMVMAAQLVLIVQMITQQCILV